MRTKDPKKMKEMIDFIDAFYLVYHRTPSVREIAEGTTLSKSSVATYLAALRDDGEIDYDKKLIRTDRINGQITGYIPAGIIGAIPCGQMEMETENVEEYVNLPISIFGRGELYILRTYGDSMIGAGIDEKDLVVIRKQEYAQDGDIVVAYVEGEGNTLKRYYRDREKKRIRLHPENDKLQDIYVKDCKIQGVVVNIIKATAAGKRPT